MASLEELQAAVLGLAGVVGAEVIETASGPPTVRIWTDDSRDPDELRAQVQALVARASRSRSGGVFAEPTVRPVDRAPAPPGARRGGLGRGLDSLIAVAGSDASPAHLVSIDLSSPPSLDMIAIEETGAGVTVRAGDSGGTVAEAKAIGGAGAINPAIVAAVAELLGELPAPRLVSVELRDTEVASVLVLTLELADGTVTAGAAIVHGGMPFTLGKAAWAAIRSARA